jgi:hypothetical protein
MYSGLISSVVDYHLPLLRNIKGIRESQDLFDDLGDDAIDTAVAFAAESRETVVSHAPLITRPFDYGAVITYPFLPENWQGTRFSDGLSYGVWYGSEELETTVYETAHHWRRFILDSFAEKNRTITGDRRVFKTMCNGILVDLRRRDATCPDLVDPRSYTFTQPLGRYLHEQNQNGLLVRSARCTGINAAIFTPTVLSNHSDLHSLTYRMNPAQSAEVTVERSSSEGTWLTIR